MRSLLTLVWADARGPNCLKPRERDDKRQEGQSHIEHDYQYSAAAGRVNGGVFTFPILPIPSFFFSITFVVLSQRDSTRRYVVYTDSVEKGNAPRDSSDFRLM